MKPAPIPAAATAPLPPPAYTPAQIVLHWLSVCLMSILVLSGEVRHLLISQTATSMRSIMVVHIGCGMALLVVTLVRAGVRMRRRRAAATGWRTQDACAHAVHAAIYVVIVGECLLGWIIVNAKGFAIPLPMTGLEFPRLVSGDPALVIAAIWAHEVLARMMYALLALHIAAALWHHYVWHDNTMARMRMQVGRARRRGAQGVAPKPPSNAAPNAAS